MQRKKDAENYHEVIIKLSLNDNLEDWHRHIKKEEIKKEEVKKLYDSAIKLWIERKILDGSLLLHPDIRDELIEKDYQPSSIHKKMIWASILASYEGSDSKEYFRRVKIKIIKKHGNTWWFDIYNRIKPAYAAKQRLMKMYNSTGAGFKHAVSNSTFLNHSYISARDDILRMIPRN
ncbi:hypothetical protein ABXV16_16970 [Pantoea leporis]|uniref:Uncharacterized protein n=1 Tax=Pantoea leporis TaxID=2933780 RepID=A0ABV2E2E1_9GAMM